MRIAIDVRMMGPQRTGGIGHYIEELVRAMLEMAPEHAYILYGHGGTNPFQEHHSVEWRETNIPWYGFAEQWKLPGIFQSAHADIVHIPHWNVPISLSQPFVITVHDLLLRTFPSSAQSSLRSAPVRWVKQCGYRLVSDRAMQRASQIFVPTHVVAKEVALAVPEAQDRIQVTGEGMPMVDLMVTAPSSPPYLLIVGSAYPHKRLEVFLEAWQQIAERVPHLRLVHVGRADALQARLKQRFSMVPRVQFLGKVSPETLEGLYRGALAFVYPSAAEGFGLPPLEALARGCPAIVSDIPVHREVLGNAPCAWLGAEHLWPDVILEVLQTLLDDPLTIREQALRAAEQLSHTHNWQLAAQRTLHGYAEVRHKFDSRHG